MICDKKATMVKEDTKRKYYNCNNCGTQWSEEKWQRI